MTEEQEIDSWFKHEYRQLQNIGGQRSVPFDLCWPLSEEYKERHQTLIDRRKTEQAQQARMQAFDETHSERLCRECHTSLVPHIGRGRPPVRCESCRNDLARKS